MKKIGLILAAAVICAAMLLGGCSEYGFYSESGDEPVNASSVDETILEEAYSNMCLTMYADGSFSGSSSSVDIGRARRSYDALKFMRKVYPASSYVELILKTCPDIVGLFDTNEEFKNALTPALYITFDQFLGYDGGKVAEHDPETEKQAFFRTAEWIMGKLGDKELLRSAAACIKKNGFASAKVGYSIDGEDVISADAYIDTMDGKVSFSEKFHISGKPGFEFGGTFVLGDTEKLVLSGRDSAVLSLIGRDIISEDCKVICSENDRADLRFDLAEIAKKLPKLKELHLYQAGCVNREAVADMKNLETLSYYVLGETSDDDDLVPPAITDCPFKGMKNLKSLRLYADYEDYSFLNEMPWLEDIHVDVGKTDAGFESLFSCPGITSLDIDGWYSDMNYDLGGIEKLTRLKTLRVTCFSLDFAPLGKLKNLEDLYVRCTSSAKHVSDLAKAPKLRKLILSDLGHVKDWSFLQDMPSLTDLTLYYIPTVNNSDIAPLKQLTSLTLSDTGCNVAAIAELPDLEVYSEIMGDGGDFSVFEKCTHLRELYLLGCAEGVMDCAYVRNAPLEVFCCNGTEVANPEILAEIITLKSITIAMEEGGIDCGDLLREALPDCEINVDSPAFFHNKV